MLVYGKNVLLETDVKKIKKVYISRKEYIEYLREKKISYDFVDNRKLDTLVNGVHQGVVLDILDYDYGNLESITGDFVVVLDHLSDPHNFGAIIRTCACAGVKDIIIPSKRSVSVNDTVIKVSAGNIDKVNIVMVSNIVNALNALKKKNYFVYSTEMGGRNFKKISYAPKKILVIGNEGDGVSSLVLKNSDEVVSIDIMPNTESLNASVAAGVMIYEMRDFND
ncbi:MAG: 23S rRNA (guanosine(2251)-2'-O)-methyltransferase RlmB [bacterium]